MIVSKATSLIALVCIRELTLLARTVHHMTLAEPVWGEVTPVAAYPGAESVGQATWLAVRAVPSVPAEAWPLTDGVRLGCNIASGAVAG